MRLFRQQRSEVSKREATLTVKNPTLKHFIRVQFLVKFYFYKSAYQLHLNYRSGSESTRNITNSISKDLGSNLNGETSF